MRIVGRKLTEVSLPHSEYAVATYYLVATAEASSNLARYDGVHYGHRADQFDDLIDMYASSRGEGFGDEVKRRIMLGTYALSAGYYDAYYLKALKVRRLIRNDFDQAFTRATCSCSPVTPTPAFKIGEKTHRPAGRCTWRTSTRSANLAGLPGMALPGGAVRSRAAHRNAAHRPGVQRRDDPPGRRNVRNGRRRGNIRRWNRIEKEHDRHERHNSSRHRHGVHVESATATKMFCRYRNHFGDRPTRDVCPVCIGMPGRCR